MSYSDNENSPLVQSSQIQDFNKLDVSAAERRYQFYVKYGKPCVAEFIGTCLFVFIGSMAQQNDLILGIAIAHGLCFSLLLYSFGQISGGHFNPAITFGVALCNGIQWKLVPAYIISQLLGSILGASFTRGCLSIPGNVTGKLDLSNSTVFFKVMGGATTLHDFPNYSTNVSMGILTESILTYLLVSTVILTAVDKETKSAMYGLSIGLAVTVSIVAGGTLTEASMNPARSFGPAVVISDIRPEVWNDHYIYWVGPMIGAFFAAFIYRLLLAERDRMIFKPS